MDEDIIYYDKSEYIETVCIHQFLINQIKCRTFGIIHFHYIYY